MASTEKRNIDLSKLTSEYLVPKIDLLGATQLSIDAIPSVEELRYLGSENLNSLKLTLRDQERKLRAADMKVRFAVVLASSRPENWQTYRPLDTITEEEKAEAQKAFAKNVSSNPQTTTLMSDQDFLKSLNAAAATSDLVDRTVDETAPSSFTYKCNYNPGHDRGAGDKALASCRFGTYIAMWCRSEKVKHCNLPEKGYCGSCQECNPANYREENCVFVEANQEILNRCHKFLHGLRGRLKVSQDVLASYIHRVTAASANTVSKPLFPMLRRRDWLKLGEVIVVQLCRPSCVPDGIKLYNALVCGMKNPDAPVAQLKTLIDDGRPKIDTQNSEYGDPCLMRVSECDYLSKNAEFRAVWLRCCDSKYATEYLDYVFKR